jgi:hypothetical protein
MRRPALLIAFALSAVSAVAQDADVGARSPEGAIACAAARYRGEALSVRWKADDAAWELRWLTPASNVLRIQLAPPGCRFLRIDGVGQEQARIPPAPPR